VPSPDQRRCRLYTVFQFPNGSGRSRHGHPPGSGRKSRRSPAGDHSTGAPAPGEQVAAAPAAPTPHQSDRVASAGHHPRRHPSGNDTPRSTGHALISCAGNGPAGRRRSAVERGVVVMAQAELLVTLGCQLGRPRGSRQSRRRRAVVRLPTPRCAANRLSGAACVTVTAWPRTSIQPRRWKPRNAGGPEVVQPDDNGVGLATSPVAGGSDSLSLDPLKPFRVYQCLRRSPP
jgi:hypothetical protein